MTMSTVQDGTGDVPPGTAAPPGPPPPDSVAGPPARRRRTYALAAAGAVAVVALAAGVTAALRPGPVAPSPIAAVTSALTRTSAASYTFSLDTTVHYAKRTLSSDAVSGAFDPGRDRGTERLTSPAAGKPQRAQIRFIGAQEYTSVSPSSGFAKPWDETPVKVGATAATPPGDLYGFVSDRPVSPAALMVVLRASGTAVRDAGPVSGPGWAGTKYTFAARLYNGRESVSGTAYVDQQGRVRRLSTITIEYGARATGKTLITTDRVIAFGDFGAPVRVTAPPASQTKRTSGQPYWGFYF